MAQTFSNFDLPEVKRFYLPGVVLTHACPTCKKELTWDGATKYILYPSNGGEYTIPFWCDVCKEDILVEYKFDFVLTVTPCSTGSN